MSFYHIGTYNLHIIVTIPVIYLNSTVMFPQYLHFLIL